MRCVAAGILVALCLSCSGCLVLSLQPVYDDDWIAWDPSLVGTWYDADDHVTLQIEAAEWRSYRVQYDHPSEKGELTAYLTTIADDHYLDVTPLRGQDHGSFLIPVHGVLHVQLDGDQLELRALSYDWFSARLKARTSPGIATVFDQKQNAVLTAPTVRLRSWLRALAADSRAWGPSATFTRSR